MLSLCQVGWRHWSRSADSHSKTRFTHNIFFGPMKPLKFTTKPFMPLKVSLVLSLGLVPSDLILALTFTLMTNLDNGCGGCSNRFDSNLPYMCGSKTISQTRTLAMYCAKPYRALSGLILSLGIGGSGTSEELSP